MAQGGTRVFLDTSVLITATLSSKGGSFYILARYRGSIQFSINEYVLGEALDVLTRKFVEQPTLAHTLFLLIGFARIRILPDPPKASLRVLRDVIEESDIPILASASEHCDYLLTLDHDFRREKVRAFAQTHNLTIVTPREFIASIEPRENAE